MRDDLTVPGHDEVFVVGDMAAVADVPGIAPAAMQQGRFAAKTIRRRLAGRADARPFRYVDKGTLAVIGQRRAVGVAFGVPLTGLGAMLIWALVHVRYLVGWGNRLVTDAAVAVDDARPQPRRARDLHPRARARSRPTRRWRRERGAAHARPPRAPHPVARPAG